MRDALKVENEMLKSELAFLQAQLRGAGVEKGLTYHAVQTQQLQLWAPDVCAGLAFQTSVTQHAATPAGACTDTTPRALTVPTDNWSCSYPVEDSLPVLTEDSAGPSANAEIVHAVNVFGPHMAPLSTSYVVPQEFLM